MSATNLEIVTDALQKIGVLGETQTATPEQQATGLRVMNDYLLNQAADGLRLGWYKQTNMAATAPLRDQDIFGVKCLMAAQLAAHYGVKIVDPVLLAVIGESYKQLIKRSIQYLDSDLGELQRPQGGPWGGPSWFG
jgi:hypothetical protein